MEKIKQINITRSYARKIHFGKDQWEMCDIFSSYTAVCEEGITPKDRKALSDKLYKTAKEEVDFQVEILQNPGKVVRGFATINELTVKLNQAMKKIELLEKKIPQDIPFVS